MKQADAKFRIRMPVVHLERLILEAKKRGQDSSLSMVREFLDWGFDAFCKETATTIETLEGPITFMDLWGSLFRSTEYAHGRLVYITPLLPRAYIRKLQKSASIVIKAISLKNTEHPDWKPIEATFLIGFFFKLKFDDFCKEKTNASP